ncbi:MAG: hypothetical protein VX910_02285 [Candidatus Latescibacterota bacterium]|nr:hypothetical protein [Candidatus Latescibacterota bacterium]
MFKTSFYILFTVLITSHAFAQRAIVATTDFTTGSLSAIDTKTQAADTDLLLIHGDAKVRAHNDLVFVLNRLGQDNIIVMSKDDLATPITQYSTGDGTNPHEIAVLNTSKAYVTLYEKDYVLVINPMTGDSINVIDLSAFSDMDGLPEASQMALFGNHLFIAAQRLNREAIFSPTDFSTIVVVDIQTDTVVDLDQETEGIQGIFLEGTQPFGQAQRGGKWIIANVGTFGAQDGGIEIVDLVTMRTSGSVISEAALDGDVGAVSMLTDDEGYIVLTDASFANSVKKFNLTTGVVSEILPDHSGGFTPAISVVGSQLYVLDRGSFTDPASAGVKIYDTVSNTLVAGPISTGLPPSDIVFVEVIAADYDNDGTVAFEDFLLFAAAFGKRQGIEGFGSQYDLSPDGVVDFSDFLIFAGAFNN